MKPAPFRYHRASNVQDALAVMAANEDAVFLSGGQSLAPMLNLRLARPSLVIDLNDCIELAGVTQIGNRLCVGGLTRHHDLAINPTARARCPVLAEAARSIGYYAIRQRGTLGGSLAHADPAAQLALISVLLDAEIHVEGPAGKRTIPASEFFVTVFTTEREADEMITGASFPCRTAGEGWAFAQINKVAGDFALVSAAATMALASDGRIAVVRLAIGAVCDTPLRIDASPLAARHPDQATFATFAADAVADLPIEGTHHLTAAYRRDATAAMIEQALGMALNRAAGQP